MLLQYIFTHHYIKLKKFFVVLIFCIHLFHLSTKNDKIPLDVYFVAYEFILICLYLYSIPSIKFNKINY